MVHKEAEITKKAKEVEMAKQQLETNRQQIQAQIDQVKPLYNQLQAIKADLPNLLSNPVAFIEKYLGITHEQYVKCMIDQANGKLQPYQANGNKPVIQPDVQEQVQKLDPQVQKQIDELRAFKEQSEHARAVEQEQYNNKIISDYRAQHVDPLFTNKESYTHLKVQSSIDGMKPADYVWATIEQIHENLTKQYGNQIPPKIFQERTNPKRVADEIETYLENIVKQQRGDNTTTQQATPVKTKSETQPTQSPKQPKTAYQIALETQQRKNKKRNVITYIDTR